MPISQYMKSLREKIGAQRVMAPAAAMAPIANGRVLLARNAENGEWQTLGGMMDPLESPADGAVREAYEEAGVMTRPTGLIGVFAGPETEVIYGNGDIVAYTVIAFAGVLIDETATPRADQDEISELNWFTPAEIDTLDMRPFNKRIALLALDDQGRAVFDQSTWRPSSGLTSQ